MKYIVLVFLTCMLASVNLAAQTINPANMNFERGEIGAVPPGWSITDQNFKRGYKIELSSIAHSGKSSMLFSCDSLTDGSKKYDGVVMQSISPVAYLNKKVKFTAYARSEYKGGVGASFLWIKIYRANKLFNLYPIEKPILINSTEWNKYEVVAEIPNDAIEIKYGIVLESSGKVWIDDAEFDNVGTVPYSLMQLDNSQLSDLLAFSKLFSALAYHYPTRRLDSANLNEFAEYGVDNVLSDKSKNKIADKLKNIFSPISDKLDFGNKTSKFDYYGDFSKYNFNDSIYPQFRLYCGPRRLDANSLTYSKLQNVNLSHRTTPGYITQIIDVSNYLGQKAEFSVKCKHSSDNPSVKAFVSISILDSNFKLLNILVAEPNPKTKSKNAWKEITKEFEIPENCKFIKISLILDGDGKALYDDATCNIAGKNIIDNGSFEQEIKSWDFGDKCAKAGYEILINKVEFAEGKSSLELNITNEQYIQYPHLGDNYQIELSKNLYAYFPKIIINQTDEAKSSNAFLSTDKVYSEFESPSARIASVISAWAIMDNFSLIRSSKYANKLDESLKTAIRKAGIAKSKSELAKIVNEMLALFPDNTIRVWTQEQVTNLPKGLPINLEYIENGLYITKSLKSEMPIGAEILAINNIKTDVYLKNKLENIPSLSEKFKTLKAISELKFDDTKESELLKVKLPSGDITDIELKRTTELTELNIPNYPMYEEIREGLYYLDLRRFDEETLMKFFRDNAAKVRGLVLDMRGYSIITEYFFKYFRVGQFDNLIWQTPYFTDYSSPFKSYKVLANKISGNGKMKDVKLVTISDESTIGLSEANLHLLRKYKMATTVGRKTSGAATEVTVFPLPCDLSMSMSMVSLADESGNLLIGKQFEPDIELETKLTDMLKGTDTLIDAAKAELIKLMDK